MIDWAASNSTSDLANNRDKIIVICELCSKPRPQLYVVAKRKSIHHCLSCVKSDGRQLKTGQLVEYKCIDCPKTQIQKYRPGRFKNWRCHHCAMVQGHKDGKFVIMPNKPSVAGIAKLSKLAKERWNDDGYRKKWKLTRESTKDKRSAFSRQLWGNPQRLSRLSACVKVLWANCEYRQQKTSQSRELWRDEQYIIKQLEGMQKAGVRQTISAASKKNWAKNRDKMVAIINNNLRKPEVLEKIRQKSIKNWRNPQYAKLVIDRLREVFKSPRLKQLLSEVSLKWWSVPDNRLFGEQHLAKLRANMPRISSIQVKLYELLERAGIGFEKESDQTIIGPYQFDCLVHKQDKIANNLLIECQGDYWHSLARGIINDRNKFNFVNNYFADYRLLYIWEHEFTDIDRLNNRLMCLFGRATSIDFSFDNVQIRPLDYHSAKTFLDNYHYIGSSNGGMAIGAWLDGELIAAIVYSAPVRQSIAPQFSLRHSEVLELSRLCIRPDCHKHNFASWLIARSMKFVSCKLIVSYADSTVGHSGGIYKAAGFSLDHETVSDYWYVSNWVMHKRTLYGKAVKENLVEREICC